MKPNLLIGGVQKCGTTTVARILTQVDDIYIHPKELHYFNRKFGKLDYEAFFGEKEAKIVGEKTPAYLEKPVPGFSHHNTLSRVLNYVSENHMKVIICLRCPIKRAESAINHHMVKGRFNPLKRYAVSDLFSNKFQYYNVLGKGEYDYLLENLMHHKIDHRVFVLEQDVTHDWFQETLDWLEVKSSFQQEWLDLHENQRRISKPMAFCRYLLPEHGVFRMIFKEDRKARLPKLFKFEPEVADFLREYYGPVVRNTERLTGRSLQKTWLQ